VQGEKKKSRKALGRESPCNSSRPSRRKAFLFLLGRILLRKKEKGGDACSQHWRGKVYHHSLGKKLPKEKRRLPPSSGELPLSLGKRKTEAGGGTGNPPPLEETIPKERKHRER